MKIREALALYRRKRAAVKRFSKTYKFIAEMLRRRGFQVSVSYNNPRECFRGKRGIFVKSERVGPGIVGTLYCCSQCKGYPDVQNHLTVHKKIPDNAQVKCMYEKFSSPGVLLPVILYPMLKKPNNTAFHYDLPSMMTILENYVLGGKKSARPRQR